MPTFKDHDKLKVSEFAKRFENYVLIDHQFVDDSLVVSLNGSFGTGKTFFLKCWEADLLARRAAARELPVPVMVNAWHDDYCGEPLLSIINALIKQAKVSGGNEKADELKEAFKDVGHFIIGMANGIAANWAGFDPVAAGDYADGKKKARNTKPDFIEIYEARSNALGKLKTALKGVFGGEQPKSIIMVDELDRCRPDYAIGFLETIKHVFDIHGLIFVLAVDLAQLESAARVLFGSKLRFEDYYRKFVHRSFSMPVIESDGLKDLVNDYINRYVQVADKRSTMLNLDLEAQDRIRGFMTALRMTPRQIQEVFRTLGHLAARPEPNLNLSWSANSLVLVLCILKVGLPELYATIKSGNDDSHQTGKQLLQLLGKDGAEYWLRGYFCGKLKSSKEMQDNMEALGYSLMFEECRLEKFYSMKAIIRAIENADKL
jgi:hypothetical protein